jgi:hypothetical protein
VTAEDKQTITAFLMRSLHDMEQTDVESVLARPQCSLRNAWDLFDWLIAKLEDEPLTSARAGVPRERGMTVRPVPRRQWRSYGDDQLPSASEALDEPFSALPVVVPPRRVRPLRQGPDGQ